MVDEEKFAKEVEELRRRREYEARQSEEAARTWEEQRQKYLNAARTEEGLKMIEAMLEGPLDDWYTRIELCEYMPGLIAEIRRLRGETNVKA